MDQELKSMLSLLLDKVDGINDKFDSLSAEVEVIKGILPTLATKSDIARLEYDQTLIKQVLETTNQVMLGRVEQLTRQYEYFVGIRPNTAAE
jgi:hypothetical protein